MDSSNNQQQNYKAVTAASRGYLNTYPIPAKFPEKLNANHSIHAFYRMQHVSRDRVWITVSSPHHGFRSPVMGWGDRWHPAQVIQEWTAARFRQDDVNTWPLIRYARNLLWYDRDSSRIDHHPVTERVHPRDIHVGPGQPKIPTASFLVVRWADGQSSNEWDYNSWGAVGSNVSDQYITTLFSKAVYPKLGPDYEVLTVLVKTTDDLARISEHAVLEMMSGKHLAGLYFMWSCEFEDWALIQNPPIAGFVNCHEFFRVQSRIESIGIPTRFPHPSHLQRTIIAKDIYAHLCLTPNLRLPGCVKVSRSSVVCDPWKATERALKNLRRVTEKCGRSGELALGGVSKLGYSWEAMDVRTFQTNDNGQSLCRQLQDLFFQPGCANASCFVQEKVPLDLELRFIAVNGVVRHVSYTAFSFVDSDGLFRDFIKLHSKKDAANRWMDGDIAQLTQAEEIATDCIYEWNDWMLTECEQVPPALRYDFIVARGPNGVPTVYLGELCELGFSMMDWKLADTEVFGAIVDATLTDRS